MAISLDFRPHVFGPYYLLEQIAFGGMAEIYRAKTFGASGFQRELVLKRVLPNLVENPDFLDMLSNEAKLTSLLQHGNIAQVHELGLIGGVYFMTMEYLEGVSLKELFKVRKKLGKPLTPAEISFIVSEVSAGLDYAHRKTDPQGRPLGIVHCDVSPDNVLLSFEGAVKVLDFGIARAAAAFSNYKEGMVMGKFNYVAPEQASGAGVDARSDVWACGVILYEGLTGEHPFGKKGDVDTLIRIARFEKSAIEPPRKLNPAIPERLDQVVMKALAGPRDQRYPSCRHLLADLVPFVGDRAATAAAMQRMLQGTFAEAIAERRAIRAKDDEILRELQAEQAVAPGGAPEKTGTRHLPPPARKAAGLGVALGARRAASSSAAPAASSPAAARRPRPSSSPTPRVPRCGSTARPAARRRCSSRAFRRGSRSWSRWRRRAGARSSTPSRRRRGR